MTLDTFLHFIISHNETIILLTVGLICAISAVVAFRQVFGKSTGGSDVDISSIEETLKKLLSQTNSAIATVSASGGAATAGAGGPANNGQSNAEFEALKKELEQRAAMIEELKKQVASAKSGDAGSAELLAKIKNLEGKLAEYEIIEDDIADLSHYKEENARLKKEIDQIKRGGPALVDQFAEAVATSQPVEAAAATAQNAAATSAAATSASAPATSKPASLEDIVQSVQTPVVKASDSKSQIGETLDFSTSNTDGSTSAAPTVETPKQQASAVATPAPAPAVPTAPAQPAANATQPPAAQPAASAVTSQPAAPAAEPAKAAPTMKAKTDIFAEFSGAQTEGAGDPLAALGEIDTNRMLEELKDLNVDLQAGADALEEPTNVDKMAEEATKLTKSGS